MVRSNCIPGVNPRHTRTPRFPATTVLMAKSQRYRDPYWCSRWPIYTHCYCPAPIHQTHNSMKDSSLFSIPLFHARKQGSTSPFRSWMLSMSTSRSRSQRILSLSHTSFFPTFRPGMPILVRIFPYYAACLGSSSTWDICHHLHAVLCNEASFKPLSSIDPCIDLTQPYSDQRQWFYPDKSIIFSVFIVKCVSTTHLSMISSAIPFTLVPSVSTLLPFITDSLITWFNATIIMHQAMLLMIQACTPPVYALALVIPELVLAPGTAKLLCITLLATRNRVRRLLYQAGNLIDLSLWLSHNDLRFCRLFDSISCSDWQVLIIANIWQRTGYGWKLAISRRLLFVGRDAEEDQADDEGEGGGVVQGDFHEHAAEHESWDPKLMFEVRMTARIFGMTIVIPQTNELNNEE